MPDLTLTRAERDLIREYVAVSIDSVSLTGFLTAVSDVLVCRAQDIEGSVVGETMQPWRDQEDEYLAAMAEALEDRAAIVRALDHASPLDVELVRQHIDTVIAYFAVPPEDDCAESRQRRQTGLDLVAWRDANGLGTVTA